MNDPDRSPKRFSTRNFILFLLTAINLILAGSFLVFCFLDCFHLVIDIFSRSIVKLLLLCFSLLVLAESVLLIFLDTVRKKSSPMNHTAGLPAVPRILLKLFPHGMMILSIMFLVFCILDPFNPLMGFINGSMTRTLLLIFAILILFGAGLMLWTFLRPWIAPRLGKKARK